MRELREIKAAAAGALVVGGYMMLVLASGRVPLDQFAELFGVYLRTSLQLWAFLGFATILFELYRKRPVGGTGPGPVAVLFAFARDRWERDRFVSLFWPPLLFAALMASFNAFKQMILPAAGFADDPALAAIDHLLFLGHDPWRVTHALFSSPTSTLVIDRAYHGWFAPMSLGVLICAWLPASTFRARNQYLLSYIAIWVFIGSVLAWLLPSAGPCFYEHFIGPSPHFAGLNESLVAAQRAVGTDLGALHNQAGLLNLFGSDKLAIGAGISAMPSVHNGLAVLFAIGAFKVKRWLGCLFAAYAVLIWIGSIHLGWHYAVDGLAAAALTLAIWFVAGRVVGQLQGQRSASEPAPALA